MNGSDQEGATNAPSFSPIGTNIDLGTYLKQTKKTTSNNQKTNETNKKIQTHIRNVCFEFFKIFPETRTDKDWAFFGWAVKNYGLETCLDKIDYMKEHKKRYVINNPKGFLRSALEKNYNPPKFVSEKIKADKRAELSHQKTLNMIAEMETTKANMNYEAGAMALQNIIDMLDNRA